MSRYTVKEFVSATAEKNQGQGLFELETPRLLEINLDGTIWIKMGSMISYRGKIKFTREGMLDQGLGNFLKKAVSSEGAKLSRAEGEGQLYLADGGKKISIIELEGEAIVVNGNDVLAFEPQIENKITMMRQFSAMLSGGLFNVRLSGRGLTAFSCHYEPLTLRVTPDMPVLTDPNATVAWSANLKPEFVKDVSLKTFIGRGSGESFQMKFRGEGFVVVQPFEETTLQRASG